MILSKPLNSLVLFTIKWERDSVTRKGNLQSAQNSLEKYILLKTLMNLHAD